MDTLAENARTSWNTERLDVLAAASLLDSATDYDAARDAAAEIVGDPLEVTAVRCMRILLTTGGPARGYHIFLDSDDEAESGYYWYQDWGTTKQIEWLDSHELAAVVQAYGLYLGE